MNLRRRAPSTDAAARAMEAVLRAERDATAELEQRRKEAAQVVERARDEARSIVNRALERAAFWQARHARALARRVELLRARAAVTEADGAAVDHDPLALAIERLAARLTGNDPDAAR
jgi:vacuolar-type H+-ATPase subunit H